MDVNSGKRIFARWPSEFIQASINTSAVAIGVSALTKFDVEMISDYICGYMQYYGINKFADAGITILSASGSTPSTEEYGKNNIYTINLTYNLQAEWQKFVSLDDTVQRIVIPEIGVLYGEDYKERQKEDGIIIDPSIESGDNEWKILKIKNYNRYANKN